MPVYRYRTIDENGEVSEGEVQADNPQLAQFQLEAAGFSVEFIELAPGGDQPGRVAAKSVPKPSRMELDEIAQHLADLTEAELPVAPGLRAIAAELNPGRMRSSLLWMAERLEAGQTLGQVLNAQGAPADLRAIVEAGVETGSSGEAVGEYMAHIQNTNMLRRQAILALAYPAMLMIVTFAVAGAILYWVIPQFKDIFDDFGVELPILTQAALNLSDFVVLAGPWVIGFTFVVVALAIIISSRRLFGTFGRRMVNRLPMIGKLFRWAAFSRFCHLLGVLIDHGMPLPRALMAAGSGSNDPDIFDACRDMNLRMERGDPPDASGNALTGLPSSLVRMMSMRSDKQGFSDAIHAVADIYEGRLRLHASFLAVLLQPLILWSLAVFTGFLVIAMFMPLIKLLNDLS